MSKFKVGDKVRVVKKECGHKFDIGEVVKIVGINEKHTMLECKSKVSQSWSLQFYEVEEVNGYFESNRYKLHKAASATGFSFSKLSRAMGRSDTYISNESKESRFNSRGDLTDKRYNQLIIDLAYAERTLNGNPAKVVDNAVSKNEYNSILKDRIDNMPNECFEGVFNRSIVDRKGGLYMIESDGVNPIFTPKQKNKSKTEVNKSIVWFILFVLIVVILVLVAGIYKSIF